MTLILGVESKGKVFLAGDRYAGDPGITDLCYYPKVFKVKIPFGKSDFIEMGIGYAGHFRSESMVKHFFNPPKLSKKDDPEKWIQSVFFKVFSDFLASDSQMQTPKLDKTELSSEFLIAFQGMLFVFQSDYSMLRLKRGYSAIGAASPMILPAFSILLEEPKYTMEEKILKSFEAVERFSPEMKGPVDIIQIETI